MFVTTNYPVIDLAAGGTYLGIVNALERLVDIIIPVYGQDGGTLVIPGHGRLSNLGDVLNFREMVIVVRDRLQSNDQIRDDAGAGQGRQADVRLRPGLWGDHGLLDDRQVSSRPPTRVSARRRRTRNEQPSSLRRRFSSWHARSASFAAAQPRGPAQPPRTAKQSAPIDFTGQWVSIVTEDWRFRMVTPAKGDYPGIQLTPAGEGDRRRWDPAKDEGAGNQCKSYGAAGDHARAGPCPDHLAGRADPQIETDAGEQTRFLHFGHVPDSAESTWQGVSRARGSRTAARSAARDQRQPESRDHEHEGRVFAQEWRAVQREHRSDRVLRHPGRARRVAVARREGDCRRPRVSREHVDRELELPQAEGPYRLGSRAVHVALKALPLRQIGASRPPSAAAPAGSTSFMA